MNLALSYIVFGVLEESESGINVPLKWVVLSAVISPPFIYNQRWFLR